MSARLPCAPRWARMRGRMGQADTIRDVWLAALTIFGRYPLATLAPAAVLGAFGEVPAYLIEGRPLLDQALTLATAYVAYYLYLAYAEGIVRKARRGTQRLGLRACSTTCSTPRGGWVDHGVAHVGCMGGRFVRCDAGHAPGELRNLVGPLERREAGVTRCRRCQELHI